MDKPTSIHFVHKSNEIIYMNIPKIICKNCSFNCNPPNNNLNMIIFENCIYGNNMENDIINLLNNTTTSITCENYLLTKTCYTIYVDYKNEIHKPNMLIFGNKIFNRPMVVIQQYNFTSIPTIYTIIK